MGRRTQQAANEAVCCVYSINVHIKMRNKKFKRIRSSRLDDARLFSCLPSISPSHLTWIQCQWQLTRNEIQSSWAEPLTHTHALTHCCCCSLIRTLAGAAVRWFRGLCEHFSCFVFNAQSKICFTATRAYREFGGCEIVEWIVTEGPQSTAMIKYVRCYRLTAHIAQRQRRNTTQFCV